MSDNLSYQGISRLSMMEPNFSPFNYILTFCCFKPNDKKNYNEGILRNATVKIMDNELCKKEYSQNMEAVIDQYMICTWENDTIESKEPPPKVDGCKEEKTLTIHDILVSRLF